MQRIENHFASEAPEFDDLIVQLIPDYAKMFGILADLLPFKPGSAPCILDLGCGTGTLAQGLFRRWPEGQFTLLDLAAPMVEQARQKMAGAQAEYLVSDFADGTLPGGQDAVVSSLALHHLETDQDKQRVYAQIFEALKPGGVFYNLDVVRAASPRLEAIQREQWRQFMALSKPLEEVDSLWLETHDAEDRPAVLKNQLAWLEEIGLEEVEVLHRRYNFALYGGRKPG